MELVTLICEEQNKLKKVKGMSRDMNASIAVKLEPLKTPIYVMWQYLGYGDFPDRKEQRIWLSSFKTSPPEYLSECIMQIKSCEKPIDDLKVHRQLIDFYSELQEQF